jgi:hypothetical protein
VPAYSFQKQFVPFVESGEKTHTIRGKRILTTRKRGPKRPQQVMPLDHQAVA